ncbi:hypothetical protein O4H61_05035 [Roseovarius aestuarii]|nr:hypothetical protein [Roseovarius aestuarii]
MFDLVKRAALAAILIWTSHGAAMAQSGEDCLSPASLRDGDVRRNAALFASGSGLCLSELQFEENGLTWTLTVIDNTRHSKGPTFYLLHDNEDSAFETALYGIRKYGGKLVAVESGNNREFNGQDPNRNFGATAKATAPCRDMRRKPAPLFTQFMLDLRDASPNFVLTLHNNANGHSGNGGSGGISIERSSSVMKGLKAPSGGDEDDAILLAGTQPYEQDKQAQKATAQFHKAGVNVIYEHVLPERNDCSFSNYVVLNRIAPYYNIEAQHGHTAQQKAMLDVLMKFHRMKVRDRAVK